MPTPCTPDSRDGIRHRIRGVREHSSQRKTITLCNCTVLCCLSNSYIHKNKPAIASYSISHRISQESDIQKEIYLVAWLLIALSLVLFLKICVQFKNKAWHRNWMTKLSIRGHLATLKQSETSTFNIKEHTNPAQKFLCIRRKHLKDGSKNMRNTILDTVINRMSMCHISYPRNQRQNWTSVLGTHCILHTVTFSRQLSPWSLPQQTS